MWYNILKIDKEFSKDISRVCMSKQSSMTVNGVS